MLNEMRARKNYLLIRMAWLQTLTAKTGEVVIYSDFVTKLNRVNKPQERVLVMTDKVRNSCQTPLFELRQYPPPSSPGNLQLCAKKIYQVEEAYPFERHQCVRLLPKPFIWSSLRPFPSVVVQSDANNWGCLDWVCSSRTHSVRLSILQVYRDNCSFWCLLFVRGLQQNLL